MSELIDRRDPAKKLINVVKMQPCLWDTSHPAHRNKIKRLQAWDEVFRSVTPFYDSLSKTEKKEVGMNLMKKWQNIRDAYKKSIKSPKYQRPYVYAHLLQFLEPTMTSSIITGDTSNEDDSDKLHEEYLIEDSFSENEEEDKKAGLVEALDSSYYGHGFSHGRDPTKRLIQLIGERPCLWDRQHPDYKNKISKEESWREIYSSINPQFNSLTPAQQKQFGMIITKKWYNVRDAYNKSRKNPSLTRPYIYSEHLSFLDSLYGDYKSDFQESVEVIYPGEVMSESQEMFTEEEESNSSTAKKIKLTKDDSSAMLNLITQIIQKEDDEDKAFFKSIMPSVKGLSGDVKMQFRISVLKLLRKYKNKETSRSTTNASDDDTD